MKSISYTSLIVSVTLLYWFTSVAYNRVIRVDKIDYVPVFQKQKCVITHLYLQQENKLTDDLNIYYSGMKTVDDKLQKPVINQEAKIQEEILKIVKEKQIKQQGAIESLPSKAAKNVTITNKKVEKKQSKIEKKREQDDDAFSLNKPRKTDNKNQSKKNIFDVIE